MSTLAPPRRASSAADWVDTTPARAPRAPWTLAACGLPIDPFDGRVAPLSPARQAQLVWWFVWLGLAARAVRYFLRFPLWEDECFVSINLIDRGFGELVQPLDFHQVAPIGFLWAQLALVKLLGYHEWSLRLVSLAASVASLFLFRHVAGRLLKGVSLVLAVAIFAVAYPCIRYAAEAKPYGSDLFVSLAMLAMVVEWWRMPSAGRRWLWRLAAFTPLAVAFSYPAVFTGGALGLFVAWMIWRSGQRRAWLAWTAYNLALVSTFAAIFALATRYQSGAELEWMGDFWQNTFPPLGKPWKLPWWLVTAHTGDLFAYPVGGGRGASTLTALCVAAAAAFLVRRRRYELAALCAAPLAMNLLAAAMHRYPYGGHVKLIHYAAPVICLMAALGATALLARWAGRARDHGRRAVLGVLAVLAAIACASIARDVSRPYKTLTDARARDFARWFWFNAAHEGEAACVNTDFGQTFAPQVDRVLNWTAMYACNRAIYAPPAARQRLVDLSRVTRERPLRCVYFRSPLVDEDMAAFEAWLAEMRSRFELAGEQTLPITSYDKRERRLLNVDTVTIYRFVPKPHLASAEATAIR